MKTPFQIKMDIDDDELARSKTFVNTAGYDNNTAMNLIVRQYRTALKEYRKIVDNDCVEYIENI